MKKLALVLLPLSLLVVACSSSEGTDCLDGESCNDPNNPDGPGKGDDPGTTPANAPPAPLCADTGKPHVGLGGTELTVGRAEAIAQSDRGRMKPYSVLQNDYARVLGAANNPGLIGATGSTFGSPPARWYSEPQANAVALFTAFRVAFEGCLEYTGAVQNSQGATVGDAKYGTAPDAAAARTECSAWARKFWSRDATPDELQACVDVAVTDSVNETVADNGNLVTKPTEPKRRWAYACATVLSSTGFLAY